MWQAQQPEQPQQTTVNLCASSDVSQALLPAALAARPAAVPGSLASSASSAKLQSRHCHGCHFDTCCFWESCHSLHFQHRSVTLLPVMHMHWRSGLMDGFSNVQSGPTQDGSPFNTGAAMDIMHQLSALRCLVAGDGTHPQWPLCPSSPPASVRTCPFCMFMLMATLMLPFRGHVAVSCAISKVHADPEQSDTSKYTPQLLWFDSQCLLSVVRFPAAQRMGCTLLSGPHQRSSD